MPEVFRLRSLTQGHSQPAKKPGKEPFGEAFSRTAVGARVVGNPRKSDALSVDSDSRESQVAGLVRIECLPDPGPENYTGGKRPGCGTGGSQPEGSH